MSLLDNFRLALDSLWSNRMRSFLALLGIVIGVFAVTAMVSLGQMASAGINKSLESVASRSIIVQPDYNTGLNLRRLKGSDLQALARLPVSVNPQLQVSTQYEKKPGERRTVSIIGTLGDLRRIDPSIRLSKGRYFTISEERIGQPVVVLNPSAVRELLRNTGAPLGKRIRLYFPDGGRAEATVVGVIEPLPAMFGGDMPMGYMPINFLWRNHPDTRRGEYDYAILRVRAHYDIKVVEQHAKRIMEGRYGKGIFMVQSVESLQNVLGTVTSILQIFLGLVAGLSLLVGGIGIMNIMLVSVTERTREIGLRKAIGATSAQIRLQFLIEAMLLTFFGGSFGVVLAALTLWLIASTVPFLNTFILSPTTIVIALVVSVGVGLFFGVWPAGRAANLDPIESLRYE